MKQKHSDFVWKDFLSLTYFTITFLIGDFKIIVIDIRLLDFINILVDFHFLKTLKSSNRKYDGVFVAVNHSFFKKQGIATIKNLLKKDGIFFDFKSTFGSKESESW